MLEKLKSDKFLQLLLSLVVPVLYLLGVERNGTSYWYALIAPIIVSMFQVVTECVVEVQTKKYDYLEKLENKKNKGE